MRLRHALFLTLVSGPHACDAAPGPQHEAYAAIVHEEDARGARGLERIRTALASPDPVVRALAVRALGRMEDPALMRDIAAQTGDTDPGVRSAAALALGQAVFGQTGTHAFAHLLQAFAAEKDPTVLGALATAGGWITPADREELEALTGLLVEIAEALPTLEADSGLVGFTGLARGIEALVRRNGFAGPASDALADLAARLASTHSLNNPLAAGRVRTLATAALVSGNRLSADALARAAEDEHFEVRRQAALAVTRYGTAYRTAIPPLLMDVDSRVRLAALGAYDRWLRPSQGCGLILERLEDTDPHVAMRAADLLARPCLDLERQRDALSNLMSVAGPDATPAGPGPGNGWHLPARALWALAGVAPEAARERLEEFSKHSSPFARAWTARAAAQAGATGTLELLARDADPNVRTAAITGLARLEAYNATATYRAQLSTDDPQLVMTAVRLLPADDPSVLPDVLGALARFTVMRRDNSRDVRTALLDFAGASPALAPDLIEPYLQDFDPKVAHAAAAHLEAATGQAHTAAPAPLEPTGVPSPTRLAQLEHSVVVLQMTTGGRVVVTLRPDLAATNADRFARLAQEGYFDGLTFHRVVPNFVIQGGSPAANEFLGDAAFSRDEISHESHWRGTVGLSTRGRDTGDAQIFVNLVDNPRLDFNYTIYGEVTEGMDVVDGLLEGAVIKEARMARRRRP